jgi:hypothetical protein
MRLGLIAVFVLGLIVWGWLAVHLWRAAFG